MELAYERLKLASFLMLNDDMLPSSNYWRYIFQTIRLPEEALNFDLNM